MSDTRTYIYDLTLEEINDYFRSIGEPSFRARQLWQGLYKQYWDSSDQFSAFPSALRSALANDFTFLRLSVQKAIKSKDLFTTKTLFHIPDSRPLETVLMEYDRRRTLCISSQSGCAMGCVFCATGQLGFQKNLTSGEIIEQVLYYARQLRDRGETVTNVVVMGMGEPFHNYQATMDAIDRLNHPEGMNLGARRFTISTVGLIPAIQRFTSEKRQVNLAVSLHAADNDLRSSLLPVNKKYPVESLIASCRDYVKETGRRITFEWALIQDVNDRLSDAQKLCALVKGLLCHVNIIPLNPTKKYAGSASTREKAAVFQKTLADVGISCTIRVRRGIEIAAGCGQLAGESSIT